MKTDKLIYLILLTVLIGCDKRQSSILIADELRGNIFEISSNDYEGTGTIEFKDSTYTIYENGIQNLEWYAPILTKGVLILDRKKINFQKVNDSVFLGNTKSDTGQITEFKLTTKQPNWSVELLNGTWMIEKHYMEKKFDEEDETEIVYPTIKRPKGLDTSDFEPYPIFKIHDGKLTYKKYYGSAVTKFNVIKNNKYMALNLENQKMMRAKYFKIMSQKDSLLYVDLTDKVNKTNDSTQFGFLKFIKIR